jgi:hypothetical protein
MMQRRSRRRAAMIFWAALAISVAVVPGRADTLIIGPSDEATRTINGTSAPTLDHAQQLLTVLVDGADQLSVDSDLEFDIASITTLPHHVTVESATLFLAIAGAQTIAGPGSVSVNGYPDGDGIVGLGDFEKPTTFLGATGALPDGFLGTEDIPFQFDVTGLIQSIADHRTMNFVGFHLEGPAVDSEAFIWGLASPDPAEQPRLEITFTGLAVPEPRGALLMGLGLAGPVVLAWWRRRRATFQSRGPEVGGFVAVAWRRNQASHARVGCGRSGPPPRAPSTIT